MQDLETNRGRFFTASCDSFNVRPDGPEALELGDNGCRPILSDRSPFTDHMRARVYHMQLAAACDRAAIEALPVVW
jgi:hypothetical protein